MLAVQQARWLRAVWLLSAAAVTSCVGISQAADFTTLERQYQSRIRALLESRCITCHSTVKREGELDMEQLRTLPQLREATAVWQHAIEMLDTREMPPRDATPLTDPERGELRGWFVDFLNAEADATAGDPGPVVLRRLNNVEYTNSIQALTGQPLQPAREFPADSAAGEGFTNTGSSLVMSPAMLGKYMNAAKGVAEHVILLPDGIRFSPHATRRDWTDDVLARIRSFYAQFTDATGATRVTLQGLQWDTNAGGRLPLAPYMSALVAARDDLKSGRTTTDRIAQSHQLNAKYMGILWSAMRPPSQSPDPSDDRSMLLKRIATEFERVTVEQLPKLLSEITAWQQALNRFQSVGHMKPWIAAIEPLVDQQQLRVKLDDVATKAASSDATDDPSLAIDLIVDDAGDGADGDRVLLSKPRLVAPGRRDVFVVDAQPVNQKFRERRQALWPGTAACLTAAATITADTPATFSINQLADQHSVDPVLLTAWLNYLSLTSNDAVPLPTLYTNQLRNVSGYTFVHGWGSDQTPSVLASSGDMHVRIPGNMKPHGVVVHPSPTLNAVVSWRSPITGLVSIESTVTHAHPECGNGVTWAIEVRRGNGRQRLTAGVAQGGKPVAIPTISNVRVRQGELISLIIGPRDGNHACDLTDIEFQIRESAPDKTNSHREWSLTQDVSPDILSGNPHSDSYGNGDTWNFYAEPIATADSNRAIIPTGSLADEWLATNDVESRKQVTQRLAELVMGSRPMDAGPNRDLWDQVHDLNGPLLGVLLDTIVDQVAAERASGSGGPSTTDMVIDAPKVVTLPLPVELCRHRELIIDGTLAGGAEANGTVQLFATARTQDQPVPTTPSLSATQPIVSRTGSAAAQRFVAAAQEFRQIFPAALCYTKIVPVDEVVTLALFHREDENLRRLMLSDAEAARLDQMWQELHFVSEDLLTVEDAYEQLMQYATQDSDPKLFEHLRAPIKQRANEYRAALVAAQPQHRRAVLEFAQRAYRRPLTREERAQIDSLYDRLRNEGLSHDASIRLQLVKILVSPHFLYRLESAPAGKLSGTLSDWELASRLSYFLWSGPPDTALLDAAANGQLQTPEALATHARRMMTDDRCEHLAREFACHWLDIHDVAQLNEKSERHFPEFTVIRGDLQKEAELFFTDLIKSDGSVRDIFDANYTFLNERLAKFYGIAGVTGDSWRRVDEVRQHGRGGVLTFGATLARQSGASRTSPILRGNWVSEVLLGEKLPRPPKDVPQLPSDEATESLSVRQLVERHSSDARCANCHVRIDPFGFAMEGYDAIGRLRANDLAGHPIDTTVKLHDGTPVSNVDELRSYLVTQKRDVLMMQFCRKLLGYALGRSIRLSDQQLIRTMQQELVRNDYRFSVAVETIVKSRQFMQIRGAQSSDENGEP